MGIAPHATRILLKSIAKTGGLRPATGAKRLGIRQPSPMGELVLGCLAEGKYNDVLI